MPTIADELFAPPSTNPDDYPTLRPPAPGTLGADLRLPPSGWTDESIPAEARINSFVRERGRDMDVKWDQIATESKSLFGIDAEKLRKYVELEKARTIADKDQTLSEGDYATRVVTNLARDLPFSPFKIIEDREYHKARKRFEEGKSTGQDIGTIANYEARQKRLKNESDAIQAARVGSGLAKMGAEFALGGPVAGAAGRAAGLGRLGTFGVETATRAVTVPSLGSYDAAFERAFQAGRTLPNAKDIVQGYTVGLANSAIAGQIERFGATGLARLGIHSPAATIPIGAVTGSLEDEVSDAVLKNLNLETRYGPMVELMQGKRGDNLGRLAHSLIGEGIFAGVGAMRGKGAFDATRMQAVIDAGAKAVDAEARTGKSATATAQSLWEITEEYRAALHNHGTTDLFLKAARERMGETASPAAKQLVEDLAKTLPKEIDPFEGLNEQQIKDVAQFIGVDKRGSTRAIKDRILASEAGQALFIAEGRLPRPENPQNLSETPAPEPANQQPVEVTPEKPAPIPESETVQPRIPSPENVQDAPGSTIAPPEASEAIPAQERPSEAKVPVEPELPAVRQRIREGDLTVLDEAEGLSQRDRYLATQVLMGRDWRSLVDDAELKKPDGTSYSHEGLRQILMGHVGKSGKRKPGVWEKLGVTPEDIEASQKAQAKDNLLERAVKQGADSISADELHANADRIREEGGKRLKKLEGLGRIDDEMSRISTEIVKELSRGEPDAGKVAELARAVEQLEAEARAIREGPRPAPGAAKKPASPARSSRSGAEPEAGWLQSDVGQTVERSLASAPDLAPEQRAQFAVSTSEVLGRMPESARAALGGRLQQVNFYPTHQAAALAAIDDALAHPDMKPEWRQEYLDLRALVAEGRQVPMARYFNGKIYIDGAGKTSETGMLRNGQYGWSDTADIAAIYAHEAGHGLEASLEEHEKMGWAGIWVHEIKGGDRLSRYAATSASEGIAEFSRLLYGSNVSTEAIRRDFPNASRFFSNRGWFPAERDGRNAPAGEAFGRRVGPTENHVDLVRTPALWTRMRAAFGWASDDARPPEGLRETALANARVDEERVARGVPPLLSAARLANPEVWDRAMERIAADPELPARLTNELATNPRATTVDENAILLHRRVTIQNAHNRAMSDLVAAQDANAPPGDVDRLAATERGYLESLERLESVLRKTGTEWGRAGQFRRQLAKEDYSLGSMLLRAQAAAGRPLTEKERQSVITQQKEIEATETRLAAAEVPVSGAFGTPGRVAQPAAAAGQKGDLTDLRIAMEKAKRNFTATLEDYRVAKLPTIHRATKRLGEATGFVRSLRTAFDLSMLLRQGGVFAITRPITTLKTARRMQEFVTEHGYDRVMMELRSRPNAALYADSGLYLADVHGSPSAQEEAFTGGLAQRMAESGIAPVRWLGQGVRGSERLYTGHLNLLRANVFDAMVESLSAKGRPTLEEARAVANMVNVATGRGPLGETLGKAAAPLSQLFFSPRFVASRFQLLAGQPLYGGTAASRKLIALEYARLLAGLGLFYSVIQFLAGDEAEITFDPRSTDFGKVRIGNTAIDPLAGLSQTTRFVGQLATGEQKDRAGVVTPIRGKDRPAGGDDMMDVISDFVRQKLAPAPSQIVNVFVGENGIGEPTTVGKVAVGLFVPMSVENIYEGFDRLDVPRATGTSLLNVLGVGVNLPRTRDEGALAIGDVHAMRRRWEYEQGRPPEPRQGQSLVAGMLKAASDDDFEAFRSARIDFLNRQIASGRTRAQALESFRDSVNRIDPLEGRLNERDRNRFLRSLSAEQREQVSKGRTAARRAQIKLRKWWAEAR